MMLAENLAIEAQAMHRGESELLLAADFGPRLADMQGRMERSVATGEWVVVDYAFDSLHLRVVETAGGQGADLGFEATGTVERVTYDADGVEVGRRIVPVSSLFVLRQATGDRWLIMDERGEAEAP
jgi:hypothetical protein